MQPSLICNDCGNEIILSESEEMEIYLRVLKRLSCYDDFELPSDSAEKEMMDAFEELRITKEMWH